MGDQVTEILWMSQAELLQRVAPSVRPLHAVTFVAETAKNVLECTNLERFSAREIIALKGFTRAIFLKSHKKLGLRQDWQEVIAAMLYELFRLCRRLAVQDQETVGHNFRIDCLWKPYL